MIFLDVKGGLFCKKRMDELDGWTEVVFLGGEDGWRGVVILDVTKGRLAGR